MRTPRPAVLVFVVAAAACSSEPTPRDDPDTAIRDSTSVIDSDTAIDTRVSDLDDGACAGHDEDKDGIPDECDNCPNVENPDQAGGAIGTACNANGSFITSPSRLLFEPFLSLSSGWTAFGTSPGAFALAPDADSVLGGTGDTSAPLLFLARSAGAGAAAVVVTTTMTVTTEAAGGSAGIMLRLHDATSGKRGFLCAFSVAFGFAVARLPESGCDGTACSPITFALPSDAGATAAMAPVPAAIPHGLGDTIGLRASVTTSMGDAGAVGDIECSVFDPKKPEALRSADPAYAIRITASGTRWFPSGEVGLYAQKSRAAFHSIDVLRGP